MWTSFPPLSSKPKRGCCATLWRGPSAAAYVVEARRPPRYWKPAGGWRNARMKGVVIVLGILLLLAGGAVAGAKYAPAETLSFLNSMPAAKDFVASPMALYAGGGGAGFGLLLIIIA